MLDIYLFHPTENDARLSKFITPIQICGIVTCESLFADSPGERFYYPAKKIEFSFTPSQNICDAKVQVYYFTKALSTIDRVIVIL